MNRNVEQEHQAETQLGPLINSCVVPHVCASLLLACCQVSNAGPAAVPHIAECYGALIEGEWSGVDTVVRTCVTVSAAAAAGHGVLHMWVDILRAARKKDSPIHQGERHTASLDQERPPKPALQIGVLGYRKQSCETQCSKTLWCHSQCLFFPMQFSVKF